MSDGNPGPCQWRPMTPADLPGVHGLSVRMHPGFPERAEVFAEKLTLFARGCYVLSGADSAVGGYCFSHPWLSGPPPELDAFLGELPGAPQTYFIHDLTVDAVLQGRNLASMIVPQLVDIARELQVDRMALVAVNGSAPFWTRMGFAPTTCKARQEAAKSKYGARATHMERHIQ
jgi:GNAT superfamily N-acetyltransferase